MRGGGRKKEKLLRGGGEGIDLSPAKLANSA